MFFNQTAWHNQIFLILYGFIFFLINIFKCVFTAAAIYAHETPASKFRLRISMIRALINRIIGINLITIWAYRIYLPWNDIYKKLTRQEQLFTFHEAFLNFLYKYRHIKVDFMVSHMATYILVGVLLSKHALWRIFALEYPLAFLAGILLVFRNLFIHSIRWVKNLFQIILGEARVAELVNLERKSLVTVLANMDRVMLKLIGLISLILRK